MRIFGNWVGLPFEPLIQIKFRNAIGEPEPTDLPNHLKTINQYVNRTVRYQRDRTDQWSTPQETLAKGYGDCEDIVLVKRAMLLAKGWRSDQLVMLIANDKIVRQQHAVLLVLDGQNIWMLDNMHDRVINAIKPLDYLEPIVALSETSAWGFGRQVSP
jgi:predicted transglutaminase-like cysteine proteinase